MKLTSKQQKIITIFLKKKTMQSSEVHVELIASGEVVSLVTVKRALSELAEAGMLTATGSGRSAGYSISVIGRVFAEVDAHAYCAIEPDKRYGLSRYNFDLLASWPSDIFTDNELKILDDATAEYKIRTRQLPEAIQKKELERMIIELSWKSSKIEGNTYTLLDTERLILENKEAVGHNKKEAQMILNHKDAFNFVHECKEQFKTLTRKNLEELHKVIIKGLDVDTGLRRKPVGVLGSVYRPLDNIYQITEALDPLSSAVSQAQTPYAKAILALLAQAIFSHLRMVIKGPVV